MHIKVGTQPLQLKVSVLPFFVRVMVQINTFLGEKRGWSFKRYLDKGDELVKAFKYMSCIIQNLNQLKKLHLKHLKFA